MLNIDHFTVAQDVCGTTQGSSMCTRRSNTPFWAQPCSGGKLSTDPLSHGLANLTLTPHAPL